MFVPPQGFRHAATLLLTNSARAIPVDASAESIRGALERLAHDLVALADDTRAPAEASAWLIAELNTTIDRLPQSFDRERREVERRSYPRTRWHRARPTSNRAICF